jgi:MFS transporter, OFA family, oxalate/formate antiporter
MSDPLPQTFWIGRWGQLMASILNALKWPERRGLAAGVTAMGFGAGSALTIMPLAALIESSGYQAAFLYFGIGQGAMLCLLARVLREAPWDTAALLVPLSSVLAAEGGWPAVFWVAAILNFTAAATALVVLKPLRAHFAAVSPIVRAVPADP